MFPKCVLADVFVLVSQDCLGNEAGGGGVEHWEGFDTGCVLSDGHAAKAGGVGLGWLEKNAVEFPHTVFADESNHFPERVNGAPKGGDGCGMSRVFVVGGVRVNLVAVELEQRQEFDPGDAWDLGVLWFPSV